MSGIGARQMREFGKICNRLEMGRLGFGDQVQDSFHAVLSAKRLLMIPEIGIYETQGNPGAALLTALGIIYFVTQKVWPPA